MPSIRLPYSGFSPTALRIATALTIGLLVAPGTTAAVAPEDEFIKANEAVMDRMMSGMAAKPSGNVDADFVNMMEPHHRGAIEMAELELRFGSDAKLRRIAQEIIVDQQQEIAAMRLALGRPLPPSIPVPTQGGGQAPGPMKGMTMAPPSRPAMPNPR